MLKDFNFQYLLDLQLFGEDGGTGDGGASGVNVGDSGSQQAKNPLANVKYGIQEESLPAAETKPTDETIDRNAEFEKLIKGDYKDLYDARVQDIVQKRVKATKDIVDKYESLSPVLDLLSQKYGADASDINALIKAIEDDDSYYEDEAYEKNMSVEQLKNIKKIERENADLKRQIASQKADDETKRIYSGWLEQADKAKAKYPSLDLNEEVRNPKFAELLRSGIDVETAYTVIHKDEIIPAAMQYTAKEAEKKLANKIIANGSRPTENGINSQSSVEIKSDVSQLSKEDRAEIIRRVQRGERIRF